MPRFNRMVVNGAISDRNIFRHSVFVQVKCLQATNTKKYLLLKPHRLPYHSRTAKPTLENIGIQKVPLKTLLQSSHAVCTCLNKFTTLLGDEEFHLLGEHKILFNTGLSPSYQIPAIKKWLSSGCNYLFCDSLMALGDRSLLNFPGVVCPGRFAGMSHQSVVRLSKKVEANLSDVANSIILK